MDVLPRRSPSARGPTSRSCTCSRAGTTRRVTMRDSAARCHIGHARPRSTARCGCPPGVDQARRQRLRGRVPARLDDRAPRHPRPPDRRRLVRTDANDARARRLRARHGATSSSAISTATCARRCRRRALGDRSFLRNCASGAFMENRFGGQAHDGAAAAATGARATCGSLPHGGAARPARCVRRLGRSRRDAVRSTRVVRRLGPARPSSIVRRLPGRGREHAAPLEQSGDRTCGSSTTCLVRTRLRVGDHRLGRPGSDEAAAWMRLAAVRARQGCARGRGVQARERRCRPRCRAGQPPSPCDERSPFVPRARLACDDAATARRSRTPDRVSPPGRPASPSTTPSLPPIMTSTAGFVGGRRAPTCGCPRR